MTDQTNLFDAEGLVELTLGDGPLVRPARVGFLAGMLSTWTLGPGAKPSAAQSSMFREVARDATARAQAAQR